MSFLYQLQTIIHDRQTHPQPGSYTASLFAAGEDEILKKVGEEVVEVILAAKGQGDERVISEVADLLYHMLVLLAQRGLRLEQVEAELARRHQPMNNETMNNEQWLGAIGKND
jgi:phosphoribosyl-ATP pyrophosphohydrolase